MSDRPNGEELLAEARRALLEDMQPLLPAEHRYRLLLIANAMAIAGRELAAAHADRADAAAMAAERQLAAAIRAGAYDESGDDRERVRARIRSATVARVRLSNPKALPRNQGS